MLQKLRPGVNPIIVKELRSRMRDSRAFIILTLVLLLLGGSSYLVYQITLASTTYSSMPASPQIGQALFISLAFLELMMVSAIAPAVTAGAISGEKEKLTYEMLLATPLHPGSILWGKLTSALSYIFLLIFAAVPMASIIFIFGGVTARDLIKALIILVAVAITLGMLGLFMSTWLGRTARATVFSYMVVAALYIFPMVAYLAVAILRQAEPPRWLLVASPMSALFSAITSPGYGYNASNFFWSLGMGLGGNIGALTGSVISQTGIPRPLYHYSLPLYAFITLGLYILSSRLVLPARRWKFTRKEALISFATLAGAVVLAALAFFLTADRYERRSIFAVPPPINEMGMIEPAVPMRDANFGEDGPVVVASEAAPDGDVLAQPYPAPGQNILPEVPANPPYPQPGGLSPQSPGPVTDENTMVLAYQAIVLQYYYVDHVTQTDLGSYPLVYLSYITDDGTGDPKAAYGPSTTIPEGVQAAISRNLESPEASIPAQVVWVEGEEAVSLNPGSATVSDGMLIVFGNIYSEPDGTLLISAAVYSAEGARGKTYQLALENGLWTVIGSTGREWTR